MSATPLSTSPFFEGFEDDEKTDVESQCTSGLNSPVDELMALKTWSSRTWQKKSKKLRSWDAHWKSMELKPMELESGALETSSLARRRSRRARWRAAGIIAAILLLLGSIFGLSYFSVLRALVSRLTPSPLHTGLQRIVDNWEEPDSNGAYRYPWSDDFSRAIVPKNCHSHNDYWRQAPTYSALAAGCTGMEADVWLTDDGDLHVSHATKEITADRTLNTLYLEPLMNIFTHRNISQASSESKETGVFDVDPNISITLLIDFKNDGEKIWKVLQGQLQPLRDANWLTYFDGSTLIPGPLTIVATGNASFSLIQAQSPNRYIFYDAPLGDVSNPIYDSSNSYYASMALKEAIGSLWLNKLSSSQIETLKSQIEAARAKGLKSRYWDTPSWPISARNKLWTVLSDNGVGVLNVDDLEGATRWDWRWCVVAGINLCGGS